MTDPTTSGLSAGEIGGIFAGLVALLAAIGKGAAWALNWNDARQNSRSAKLEAWHSELADREAKLDAEIADRLARVERDHLMLTKNHTELLLRFERYRSAYSVLATELVRVGTGSEALEQARLLISEPLPVPSIAQAAAEPL